MTTAYGTRSGGDPVQRKGVDAGDAAVQANPVGGGQFTGGGEAKIRGTNQDVSRTGAANARGAQADMRRGYVNTPAEDEIFTRGA